MGSASASYLTDRELNMWSDHESDEYIFDSDSSIETKYNKFHKLD